MLYINYFCFTLHVCHCSKSCCNSETWKPMPKLILRNCKTTWSDWTLILYISTTDYEPLKFGLMAIRTQRRVYKFWLSDWLNFFRLSKKLLENIEELLMSIKKVVVHVQTDLLEYPHLPLPLLGWLDSSMMCSFILSHSSITPGQLIDIMYSKYLDLFLKGPPYYPQDLHRDC